jgi:hypothetical protein
MGQFSNCSGCRFDIFFAYALHYPLDILLDLGFFLHQSWMKVVGLTLPLSVQSVPNVVGEHS